ncbi:MAG: HAMP domain-containing histidine kinase [Candidatus Aminicenantes bacterium]|nr:HAMP domain-containing histidine kinase [Candidatus Aminicenantes bacterium]
MMRLKLSSRLRLLFLAAVVLPAGLLAFLAVRSIDREEAYIEKRLEGTLDAELVHVAGLINAELDRVREEIERSAPAVPSGDPAAAFAAWKASCDLVRTPFLLSPDFEILWPSQTAPLAEDERAFLRANREFVTDRTEIPIYQNIVQVYGREIVGLAASRPSELQETVGDESEARGAPPPGMSPEKSAAAPAPDPAAAARLKESEPSSDYAQTQTALKEFESSESIRRQVYQQARERGREPMSRVVVPDAGQESKRQAPARRESIFISEPMTFSRIISGSESGLIPRFLGQDPALFFWKRAAGSAVLGCVLDFARLKSRLLGVLPDAYSASRILTVLDEAGRPLFTPAEDGGRDWRRPFVSREVSVLLPRWEAAAYLTDPGLIRSRADLRALVLWALVLTFLVSILAGGTLVLKTFRREVELARNKTTFVTNVSHELKTPLTSIRMFAEMLKEGRLEQPAKREQYLGLMVSETDRLTRLVNNVLDFSRMEKGKKTYAPRICDAVLLARDTAEGQRLRLEHKDFRFSFRAPDEPVLVRADEEAVKQALLNLLANAENYSDTRREVEVEVAADAGEAFIRVLDRGIGVPRQQAGKLFQEFFRADDSLTARTKGTGLGLAIARRLVRDQGGDIVYAPRPGGGSLFEIRLPRVKPS